MLKSQQYGTIFGVLAVLLGFGSGEVCRDEISTKGRHFLVSVPPMVSLVEFNCSINIASSGSGQAVVLQHNGHSSIKLGNYSLLRGEVQNLYISGKSIHQALVGKQTKVIEIISTVDVAVYVTGYMINAAASFVAFPVEALSVEYSIPTYKEILEFSSEYNYLIITSLDNVTNITISNYDSYKSSTHETISRLESYTLKTREDPQIATLSSSKPVNVVVGSMCSSNCDTMYDSPIPVKYWGNKFIVPPLKPKTGYSIRLYPRTENTTVNVEYYNKTARRNITFKGMKELLMGTDPTVILSDQPVNVVQYGFTEDGERGDAFMTSVPAVTHFSNDYVFTTPFPDTGFTYRLAVTIAQSHLGGLLLNGKNVSTLNFLGNGLQVRLSTTIRVHVLQHQSKHVKFAALLYGLKKWFGFGHNLGFAFSVEKDHICENGGSCTRDGRCLCLPGFSGESCEHNIDDCSTGLKCKNGATCIDGILQFRCQCSPGWTGQYCDTDIDDCSTGLKCKNGATCIDGILQFRCQCSSGWTGQYCETAITVTNPSDLTCFSCQYTSALSFCDSIEYCTGNQTCYHQLVTNLHGHKHYKSGCTDKQICSQYAQDGQNGGTCLQCCGDNFCNSHGCGDNGLPPRESRGPLCLDCENVRNPKECDQITLCSSDEMCRIEELPWGDNSLFHLGCKATNECATESRSSGIGKASRSVPICVACCHDDFCNTNCTRQDHSQQPVIVG